MSEVYLGIDWGTHSSKWACYTTQSRRYHNEFPVFGSDILRVQGSLMFAPPELTRQENLVKGLKGVLIHDPLGSVFWGTEGRQDTSTSLGEAVAFSLSCLVNDAMRKTAGYLGERQIGVSFPNWLVDDEPGPRAAARNFREAVAVAMELASTCPLDELPRPGVAFPIQGLKRLIQEARQRINADSEFDVTNIMKRSFSSSNNQIKWGFITESGAAGLPYLRAMTIEDIPGTPGLAKLLVVDVGAGSTDIGYMLRTRHRGTGKETLYYFPPAASLRVAGNQLTHELRSHLRARNELVTEREAELRKLQGGGWEKLSFAANWMAQISNHVQEYVAGLPDHRWLPLPVHLNVVVTGGSGLVPGLKEAITGAIRNGLKGRSKPVDQRTISKIEAPGAHLPILSFDTESEYARRAVALGSSDSDRPGVNFIAEMDAPSDIRIVAAPKWV